MYYPGAVLLEIEQRFGEIYEKNAVPQALISVPIEEYAPPR
jgi:hypothetical protein